MPEADAEAAIQFMVERGFQRVHVLYGDDEDEQALCGLRSKGYVAYFTEDIDIPVELRDICPLCFATLLDLRNEVAV
jgi:hypothetical protein